MLVQAVGTCITVYQGENAESGRLLEANDNYIILQTYEDETYDELYKMVLPTNTITCLIIDCPGLKKMELATSELSKQ